MTEGNEHGERHASALAVWGALATVYVIWGSTYLAIRVAIETIPPLLMAGVRFLVAGPLLYAWAIRRGDREGDRPGLPQWRAAAIVGGALLLLGNGGVVLAEQHIGSGLASLLVATVPLWMVMIARTFLHERIGVQEVVGLLLGFAGLVLLVGLPGKEAVSGLGVGLVVFAALAWASGSMYSRRAPLPRRPLVSTALQMTAGGALLLVVAVARGELGDLELSGISLASILATLYLIVFGSWAGFSAYVWLLQNARTSLVGTYAYVNPVVAVFLGWLILEEAMTWQILVAGAVIVAAVAIIVTARARGGPRRRRPAEVPGEEEMIPVDAEAGAGPAVDPGRAARFAARRPMGLWKLLPVPFLWILLVAWAAAAGFGAMLLAVLGSLALLGVVANLRGADSRDGRDWPASRA